MSHHFDTTQAKEDPRLNCCDLYLFRGRAGTTVMAMTPNADAGISSPDAFHPEGLYAIRFDTNVDAKEELAFKFRFGNPAHSEGDEHRHAQSFKAIRAVGAEMPGTAGELLAEGRTGTTLKAGDIRAFAGLVPELWTADAFAFFTTLTNLFSEDKYDPKTFNHRENLFQNRNVMVIVLEVPNEMIGEGRIAAWATISLFGHVPEVQICRWGYPLITHLFLSNPSTPELTAKYYAGSPADDKSTIGPAIAAFTAHLSARAGQVADPEDYGERVAAMLRPSLLPVNLHKGLIQVPAPLQIAAHVRDASLTNLGGEHRAKPVPPEPDGLVADVDPAVGQEILDVAQRQRVSHVHHHDQTDDLWRAVEISERIAHAPRPTQPGQPRIYPDTAEPPASSGRFTP
ncbi:MAG: DUF4331 family protein [Methylocella sp.]